MHTVTEYNVLFFRLIAFKGATDIKPQIFIYLHFVRQGSQSLLLLALDVTSENISITVYTAHKTRFKLRVVLFYVSGCIV